MNTKVIFHGNIVLFRFILNGLLVAVLRNGCRIVRHNVTTNSMDYGQVVAEVFIHFSSDLKSQKILVFQHNKRIIGTELKTLIFQANNSIPS